MVRVPHTSQSKGVATVLSSCRFDHDGVGAGVGVALAVAGGDSTYRRDRHLRVVTYFEPVSRYQTVTGSQDVLSVDRGYDGRAEGQRSCGGGAYTSGCAVEFYVSH